MGSSRKKGKSYVIMKFVWNQNLIKRKRSKKKKKRKKQKKEDKKQKRLVANIVKKNIKLKKKRCKAKSLNCVKNREKDTAYYFIKDFVRAQDYKSNIPFTPYDELMKKKNLQYKYFKGMFYIWETK